MSEERHPAFYPLVVAGGLVEGFGLAYSAMARPEIVLEFLTLEDMGLLLVMGAAIMVMGSAVLLGTQLLDRAPLTGREYTRRVKSMDRRVIYGGALFGIGWGLSGLCPGASYASLGLGNYRALWAIVGMFVGAYVQGYWQSRRTSERDSGTGDSASPLGSLTDCIAMTGASFPRSGTAIDHHLDEPHEMRDSDTRHGFGESHLDGLTPGGGRRSKSAPSFHRGPDFSGGIDRWR